MIEDEAYYARPISLRLPIVFYEGHLPIFSFNTLVKRGLGRPGIDEQFEALFARGIDPHESLSSSVSGGTERQPKWPTRTEVRALASEADRQILDALEHGDIEQPGNPLLERAEAAFCIPEHEAMHQETLLYMWHQLPYDVKRRPPAYRPNTGGVPPPHAWVNVGAGDATLGVDPAREEFSWDNERPACTVPVKAFRMERHNVTNERFMDFVEDGGYRDQRWWRPEDWAWVNAEKITHPPFWASEGGRWWWRGLFELIALPPSWPVYVSQAEASAFARWRSLRLPTESEYQRAAFGSPDGDERRYPWGDDQPTSRHGVFDFSNWDPEPAGSHPEGASAWGIEDLMGNGWEWTSSVFAPFPGFVPLPSYPEYSADFFDGEHFVMKGASPATARELLRPSFRNWFRARYPYVYATFRCVDDGSAEGRV
ncbi:MAG: SUMF1/EgtB/PvdO family nonheme iron enzyme [Vicinamibacteria bacterium]|nr:SUMF1/EgtB/PvdO family nonheme iron enzyme [Vicinamibacteria bacterium]